MSNQTVTPYLPLRFDAADVARAAEAWGCNCGPAALAAIAGKTLDEVRSHIPGFEEKHYTNPTMMKEALASLGLEWSSGRQERFANYGLCRVQWSGPWLAERVPVKARYRKTHWIASRWAGWTFEVFDVNAISSGGWITEQGWKEVLVPWIVRQCVPGGDGRWHLTHVWEVRP
jgi:hypothetical protein